MSFSIYNCSSGGFGLVSASQFKDLQTEERSRDLLFKNSSDPSLRLINDIKSKFNDIQTDRDFTSVSKIIASKRLC